MRRLTGLVLSLFIASGLVVRAAAGGEITDGVRDDGRRYWRLNADRLIVELAQLQPEQVSAFYIARGFSSEQLEPLVATCMFQLVIRNGRSADDGAVHVPLARWRIMTPAGEQSLALIGEWDNLWASRGVPMPARLAFRWALFPAAQSLHSGDRNWGMIATGLPVGAQFDLVLHWIQAEHPATATLRALQCAAVETGEER